MSGYNCVQGHLKIILGPMYAHKTQSLVHELEMNVRSNCPAIYICHSDDQRDDVAARDGAVSTHLAGFRLPEGISCLHVGTLEEADLVISKYGAIGIDESQFFSDLLEWVSRWVREGHRVIVAGLDGDAFMRPFGQTLQLIPMADEVKKLRAKCTKCREELEKAGFRGDPAQMAAPFTLRLVESSEQKLVGGSKLYTAVCRSHWLAAMSHRKDE